MRHILASSLILSSMLFPAVANASTSTDDAAASTPNLRVSTGVTAPKLVESINLPVADSVSKSFLPINSSVGLTLTVDSNGKAKDVKVVKSTNPYWDARVVDAIQKSQFRPGKVDDTPVPVDMNLTVVIAR